MYVYFSDTDVVLSLELVDLTTSPQNWLLCSEMSY